MSVPRRKNRPEWLLGASFLLESGMERAERIAFDFLTKGVPPRLIRWTGGCGFMNPEDWTGLRVLVEGFRRAGDLAKGHHLLGGTRMRGFWAPEQIIPGITEVPIWLKREVGDGIQLYGVTPRVAEPILSDKYGTIISIEEDESHLYGGYFTTLRGDVDVSLFYQPSANQEAKYDDERNRAFSLTHRLVSKQWPALLVSYNGGNVTKREILQWCEAIETHPHWCETARVLLIRGSGRITGELAESSSFLNEHPHVVVADLEVEAIASALTTIFRKG